MIRRRETTIEDTDEAIEKMYGLVGSNEKLKEILKKESPWQTRWATLERFVLGSLEEIGLSLIDYHGLWVRERFFYEMQKRTNLDFGFCPYFIPEF